jgi:hypothetical protein
MKVSLAFAVAFVLSGCSPSIGASNAEEPAATPSVPAPTVPASSEPSSSPAPSASAAPPAAAKKIVSLTDFKLPLTIEGSATAKASKSESKDGLGGAVVDDVTPGESVRIMASADSMAGLKAKLKKLAHKPAKSFVREDADVLVFQRGDDDFEAIVRVSVKGATYLCQELGSAKSAEALEPVIAACKTIATAP